MTNGSSRPRVRNGARGWLRSSDARTMSPASCQLLHSRLKMEVTEEFESSRTAYEAVGQPMGATDEWWKIGNSNPVRVLARGPCYRLH